jgi:hypothetical protein
MAMSAALDATRRLDRRRKRTKRYRASSRKAGRSLSLRRLLGGDEVIRMLERRHGYFPKVFAWRGHRYDVCAVERCWTVSRRGIRQQVERYCFRVRARRRNKGKSAPERFEIYQDVRRNTWHMQRRVA